MPSHGWAERNKPGCTHGDMQIRRIAVAN